MRDGSSADSDRQVNLACLPAQQSHAARTGLEQLGLDFLGNCNWRPM